MVKNLFEKTVIDTLNDLKEGQGESKAFHTGLKDDVDEIKKNLAELCSRTTVLETQRDDKIKSQNYKIRNIGIVFSCISAAGVLVGIFAVFK